MMILENRHFNVRNKPSSLSQKPQRPSWLPLCWLMILSTAGQLHAQGGNPVSARFSSIKGIVTVSTSGGGEKRVEKGDSIRAGTVITCGVDSGAMLRPMPTLRMIIYPESKVRFEGAEVMQGGSGSMHCSILAGKALFHIDPPADGTSDADTPRIKVTVVTDEGVIVNHTGEKPAGEARPGQSNEPIKTATWTVQHDEGRTVVAVGEGASNVSIGKGSAAASGDIGGQIEVPQGSVIWLFNRGGKIDAALVDTISGKITNLTGGPTPSGDLVDQSKKQLVTPSSSGTTSTLGTPTSTPGGPGPTNNPSSNPDLSTPRRPLPVVSSDTP